MELNKFIFKLTLTSEYFIENMIMNTTGKLEANNKRSKVNVIKELSPIEGDHYDLMANKYVGNNNSIVMAEVFDQKSSFIDANLDLNMNNDQNKIPTFFLISEPIGIQRTSYGKEYRWLKPKPKIVCCENKSNDIGSCTDHPNLDAKVYVFLVSKSGDYHYVGVKDMVFNSHTFNIRCSKSIPHSMHYQLLFHIVFQKYGFGIQNQTITSGSFYLQTKKVLKKTS